MRKLAFGLALWMLMLSVRGGVPTIGLAEGLSVVCTIFPCYDLSRALLPDASLRLLVKPGIESHGFEPTPQDILAILDADVFVYIGGENEDWAERIVASLGEGGPRLVKLIDEVAVLAEIEEYKGHGHGIDEHIWTSPVNLKKLARALGEATSVSEDKIKAYEKQCDDLDADYRSMIAGARRRDVVFGDRFPFRYLFSEYGLSAHAAFANCTGESEPSALDIAELIERMKADTLSVIYKVDQSSDVVARTIAEVTDARILTLFSAHNVSKAQFDAGESCLSLLRQDLDLLKEGLY